MYRNHVSIWIISHANSKFVVQIHFGHKMLSIDTEEVCRTCPINYPKKLISHVRFNILVTRGVPDIRGKVPYLYFSCLNSAKIHGHNTLTID